MCSKPNTEMWRFAAEKGLIFICTRQPSEETGEKIPNTPFGRWGTWAIYG